MYLQDMVVVAVVEQVTHKIQQEQVQRVVELEEQITNLEQQELQTLEVEQVVVD